MARVDRVGHIRLIRPESHLVSIPGEQVGERRSPSPRSHHRCTHQTWFAFFTKRCSSPRRKRPMFARCVQNTNAATSRLARKTGEMGSRHQVRIAIGRTTAPTREARLTYRVK